MAKCPHCKGELTKHSSGNLYCKNCNKLFRVKAKQESTPPPQAEEKQQAAPQQVPTPAPQAEEQQAKQTTPQATPQQPTPQAEPKAEQPKTEPVQQPEPQPVQQAEQPKAEAQPEQQPVQQAEPTQAEVKQPEPQSVRQPEQQDEKSELEILKARLALVEAEKELAEKELQLAKQQSQDTQRKQSSAQTGSFKEKVSGAATKVAATPAWAWFKKHWYIPFASVLGLIIIITLMTTLIGIRGIYVNVNNPNEFYSFTATSYTSYSTEGGETAMEKGTWKTSGSKLTMTVNDEDFGKVSEDFVFSTKKAYNQLFIGESKEHLTEYKRVSIVNYDSNVAKVKVTFDMNGGGGKNAVNKVKQGNLLKKPDQPTHPEGYEFRGWYDSPYGYKNGGKTFNENYRIWEKVTYYANWDNPNYYELKLIGDISAKLTAQEGDLLLTMLQEKYGDCKFLYKGKAIDSAFTMRAHDVELECKYGDAHWQALEEIFTFTTDDSSKTCTVTPKNTEISGELIIPAYYKGYNVIIGSFENCTNLTGVVISDGVKRISENAFSGCISLTDITVHYSVLIGQDAFINTAWFDSQPDGLVYIDKTVYQYKGEMPENTSITLRNDTLAIGKYAFRGCSMLTSITIPSSVKVIENYAFYNCSELTTVNWNATECTIAASSSYYTSSLFDGCKNLTTVIIGNNVTTIPKYAFYGCTKLTSITIPDSVTNIGSYAFDECTGLASVTIGNGVASIGDYAFDGCTGLTSITIPDSVTNIGSYAFDGCTGLTSITIPDSVTSISWSAFKDCTGLEAVYITDLAKWCGISFRDDEANPLYYAHNLYINDELVTDLVIPDSTTSISKYAFYNCTGLTSATIGNSVTNIDSYAFKNCRALTSVTISNGVTSIGDSAFSGCNALASITIPDSVINIGEKALEDTAWYINQADGLVYAGKVAYKYKGEMPENTSIILRNDTVAIGFEAFDGCTGLTSITIPGSVMSIGANAFDECSGLTSITYFGTWRKWRSISYVWNSDYVVHCTDGSHDRFGNPR